MFFWIECNTHSFEKIKYLELNTGRVAETVAEGEPIVRVQR